MAETMDNVKEFIEKYCKILHLANMPAQVRARFDKYAKDKDFDGNMKKWPDLLDKELPELNDAKWKKLYDLFQNVFENMAQNQKDFKDKTYTTKAFFEQWYGDDKLFKPKQPIAGVEARINDFINKVLDCKNSKYKSQLEHIFCNDNGYFRIVKDMSYDEFIDKAKSGDYKTDPNFRDALLRAINHAQTYSAAGYGPEYWPNGMPAYNVTDTSGGIPALDADVNKWFVTTYNPAFKYRTKAIFNKLVDSGAVFEDFQKYDYQGVISSKIGVAIKETDYANKESKDFVPPLYTDKKNLLQKAGEKLDKFKENAINPWTNFLQGTRNFFTPYARNIFEAIASVKIQDKEGDSHHIKPTDGLKGILDNKDKINDKLVEKSPKARSHFKWIIDKLEIYSKKLPKAFDGALHNSDKIHAIVSQFIVDAMQEGKTDECKSAMEILSSMKYRVFDSRTMDAFSKSDMTLFSDKGFSGNKYEAIRVVTKIMDGGLKLGGHLVGSLLAAARNKRMRDHTKFNGKTKDIEAAYNNWKTRNQDNKNENAPTLESIDKDIYNQNRRQGAVDRWIERKGGKDSVQKKINDYNALEPRIKELQQDIQTIRQEEEEKAIELKKINAELEKSSTEDSTITLLGPDGKPLPSAKKREQEDNKRTLENEIQNFENKIASIESSIASIESKIESDKNSIDVYQSMLNKSNEVQNNIDGLNAQKTQLQNESDEWDENHKDKYMELMAFWDMLESFGKSHQFTFWTKKMRDKFLDGYGKGESKAQKMSEEFLQKYLAEHGGRAA